MQGTQIQPDRDMRSSSPILQRSASLHRRRLRNLSSLLQRVFGDRLSLQLDRQYVATDLRYASDVNIDHPQLLA